MPSAKSAESLVVAREADRWALLPRSLDVYMTSRRSHDRDERRSFVRSFVRTYVRSRLTINSPKTHDVALARARRHDTLF